MVKAVKEGHYNYLLQLQERIADLDRLLEAPGATSVSFGKVVSSDPNGSRSPGSVPADSDGLPRYRINNVFTPDKKPCTTTWTPFGQHMGNVRRLETLTPGQQVVELKQCNAAGVLNSLLIPFTHTPEDGQLISSKKIEAAVEDYADNPRLSIEPLEQRMELPDGVAYDRGAEQNDTKCKPGDPKCAFSQTRGSHQQETVIIVRNAVATERTRTHDELYDQGTKTRTKMTANASGQINEKTDDVKKEVEATRDQLPDKDEMLVQDKKRNVSTDKTQTPDEHKITSKDGTQGTPPALSKVMGLLSGMGSLGGSGGSGSSPSKGNQDAEKEDLPTDDMVEPPNVDLWDRPEIDEADLLSPYSGEMSPPDLTTLPFIHTDEDGLSVVLPRIYDAQDHTEEEAVTNYQETGQQMGKFSSSSGANNFMQALTQAQQMLKQAQQSGQQGQGRKTTRTINPALHWIESLQQAKKTQRTIIPGLKKTLTEKPGGSKATQTQDGGNVDATIDDNMTRQIGKNYTNNAGQNSSRIAGNTNKTEGGNQAKLLGGSAVKIGSNGKIKLMAAKIKMLLGAGFTAFGGGQGGGSGGGGKGGGGVDVKDDGIDIPVTGYRFFRFTPTKLRDTPTPANAVQIADLILAYEDTNPDDVDDEIEIIQRMDYTGAIATNPGGHQPPTGLWGPEKAIDNLNLTKWVDENKLALVVEFPEVMNPTWFTFVTASDMPERDPIRWKLEASPDGITWTILDEQTVDYATTLARSTQQAWFELTIPKLSISQPTPGTFRTTVGNTTVDQSGGGVSTSIGDMTVNQNAEGMSVEFAGQSPSKVLDVTAEGVVITGSQVGGIDSRLQALETAIGLLGGEIGGLATIQPGDIIVGFDAVPRTGFVELAGQTLTGGVAAYPGIAARYSWMVSGANLIMPDMRGIFLRSWAHGSTNDPDRAARTARVGGGTGDLPGTYQSFSMQEHRHQERVGTGTVGNIAGGGAKVAADPTGSMGDHGTVGNVIPVAAGTVSTETRPRNIAVMYQMKLG